MEPSAGNGRDQHEHRYEHEHEHAQEHERQHEHRDERRDEHRDERRDIAEVPAIEVITAAALHLMSAAAVKCGLSEDEAEGGHLDLDEARKLIAALAGLVTAAAPEVGSQHAALLRDGLRQVQLAFREASVVPDPPGQGPGERLTGPVA